MTHEIPQEAVITGVETTVFDASSNSRIVKKAAAIGLAAAVAPSLVACDNSANTDQAPEVNTTPIVEETTNPSFGSPLPSKGPVEFTPAPETAAPTAEVTFAPELTVDQIIDQIINQKKADIEKTDIKDIKKELNVLWEKYGDELSKVPYRYSETKTVTKAILMEGADFLIDNSKESEKIRINNRVNGAASFVAFKLFLYENITDPEARAELIKAADMGFDYGLTSIPQYPGKPSFNKTLLSEAIPASLSQFRTLTK